jgi:hypothetical protein
MFCSVRGRIAALVRVNKMAKAMFFLESLFLTLHELDAAAADAREAKTA